MYTSVSTYKNDFVFLGGSREKAESPTKNCKDDYTFGFNGQHKDNEIKGVGNSLDFGARIYDSRLGKWLSVDPEAGKAPNITPYRFGFNNPIFFGDKGGKFEVTPQFAERYPKVTLLLMNADKLYYNKELPPEVQKAFEGVDVKKYFNDNMRAAFEKYSTLNKVDIDEMLTPEKGPRVESASLDFGVDDDGKPKESNGHTMPNEDYSNNYINENGTVGLLQINVDIVEVAEFELNGGKSDGFTGFGGKVASVKDKGKALLSLISTIFHEGVHYGRFKTGAGNSGKVGNKENGKEFEIESYGDDIKRTRKDSLKNYNDESKEK